MQIFRLKIIDSTNNYAFDLLEKNQQPTPFIVIAEKQTAGRGKFDRRWYSPADKNLYLSIAFKPKQTPEDFSNFSTKFAGLVVDGLADMFHVKFTLKYPNDIYFNGKKLAGVLTETKVLNNKILVAVSGIGINVNADISNYPSDIKDIATGLGAILKHQPDLASIEKLVIDAASSLIS
ncbi:MAG: biotin--[acetyl-CoA-carboxylase] ligase [Puniceicoccales bacterium]|jgi:BirA family biotin operon repressor/biotin-[acetyl-CoA-carboxylase] ligase|nr:biotin--[acetyl-CoA-carboxylase] ligase [Puniceicoccales bacterium]